MKKHQFIKSGLVACLFALVFVGQSRAVDLAAAAGVMAKVESMSVNAKANLAAAALNGDTAAIAEAKKRSDAIDAAVAVARKAFSKLELDVKSEDMVAAEADEEKLVAALVQVKDALLGAVPEAVASKAKDSDKAGENLETPPNINDVPWKSEGIRAFYEELFGEYWDASAFGQAQDFGDKPATPE